MATNTELIARYNTDFNKSEHDLGAILGYTTSHYVTKSFNVQKKGATDWSLDELSTFDTLVDSGSSYGEWALRSYFGRVNYAFRDRYLFEANLRIDGSVQICSRKPLWLFPFFFSWMENF